LNIFSGPIWSLQFSLGGFWGVPRAFASLWIIVMAAGAFVFCLVLAVQGVAAQVLPRAIFLRVSPLLQIAAFCTFLGTYFLPPSLATPEAMTAAANQQTLARLPPYWFLAAYQWLSGGPHFAIAHRAWAGLAGVASIAAVSYVLSYVWTLHKILEQPDIAPAVRGLRWLPSFGSPLDTAVVRFSIRTIARSRQHRVVLAFYLGIGFAFLIFFIRAPEQQKALAHADLGILFANYAVLLATLVGIRAVYAMPMALGSNWIFRVTESGTVPQYMSAIRRPLFVMGLAPVVLFSAGVFFSIWPWKRAAGHILILGLFGTIVAYLCLRGFQKIPFTCSFLPGKSKIHMAIMASMGMLLFLGKAAQIESGALDHPSNLARIAVSLAIAAVAIRWLVTRTEDSEVRFEEWESPAVQTLGLTQPL
jgi:hypothetical protein